MRSKKYVFPEVPTTRVLVFQVVVCMLCSEEEVEARLNLQRERPFKYLFSPYMLQFSETIVVRVELVGERKTIWLK